MKSLLHTILQKNTPAINNTWVIGAGNGSELSTIRELNSAHTYLVEAHPKQIELLTKRAQPANNEKIIPVAVTTTTATEVKLQPFNNITFSSLNSPQALFEHYPNLRATTPIQVPAQSFTDILGQHTLKTEESNVLILDAPGQSLTLMQSLTAQQLQSFSWLIVSIYNESLYQHDADETAVIYWLKEIGFDLIASDDESIYPQNRLLFSRNSMVVQKYHLLREINDVRTQLESTQKENTNLIAQLHHAKEENIQLADALKNQEQLVATHLATIQALNQDKTDISHALSAQEQLVATHLATIQVLNQDKTDISHALSAQEQLVATHLATIQVLNQDKTDISHALSAQEQLVATHLATIDALSQEKAKLLRVNEAQTQSMTQQQVSIDTLTKEKAHFIQALAENNQALETSQQQLKTYEHSLSEATHRQQAMQNELIKAEAQLELIKELMLNDTEDNTETSAI